MNTHQLVPHKKGEFYWVETLNYTFQIETFSYRLDDEMRNFLGERK